MHRFLRRLIGTKNERDLRACRALVVRINAFDEEYRTLSDEQLRAKTGEFRGRLAAGETLDDIMCEAFAVVKNASRRLVGTKYSVCGHEVTWNMVPFDVQLIGGIVLHQGNIAEMATGEGKTLVATLPLYLNSLPGKGAHLVTVNDYLARRDAHWMGLLYDFVGVSAGCIQNSMEPAERRAEYAKDITYGTNSEFGFDYLRDNGLAMRPEEQVQRGYSYAIVDEVDSILIDEARTPLIISGSVASSTQQYTELKPRVEKLVRRQRELVNDFVRRAKEHLEKGEEQQAERYLYQIHQGMPKHTQLMHMLEEPSVRKLLEHVETSMLGEMRKEEARELREELFFVIDEKGRDANLTEKGCIELDPADHDGYILPDIVLAMSELDTDESLSPEQKVEKRTQIQAKFAERSEQIHTVDQLIRAYCMYEKDVEYVVQENRVLIVDEFTGRILPGRRWSDGLHQAVEAKEGVAIERETQTLATITIQNFFRMYDKLAGMTGTAETEAEEFHATYKLDVIVIPTNRPVRRVDFHDQIYKTGREKLKAVVDDITACHASGQPVLVGTVSVDTSELLSRMLKRAKIPHNVLNAKQHEREAEIVMRAGEPGAVTIATNMAGRGTDIKLGEGVVYVDRDVIESKLRLDDKYNEGTLREALTVKPCGLYVIGSERHEARRIDRQLRGRCARQGDPGASRFYVSLEDDLMRLFGSDRIANLLDRLGLEEGQVLEHRLLNRSIETAQKRVEQHYFSMRKRTLEYDDVMNRQREVVYAFRGEIVRAAEVREHLYDIMQDVIVEKALEAFKDGDENATTAFTAWARTTFPIVLRPEDVADCFDNPEEAAEKAFGQVRTAYELKLRQEKQEMVGDMERHIILHAIDSRWQDYLRGMDELREGISLRAYGQQDPLVEYKREAYAMFETLMTDIKMEVASQAFRYSTSAQAFRSFISALPQAFIHDDLVSRSSGIARAAAEAARTRGGHAAEGAQAAPEPASAPVTVERNEPKVGRNDACPCGSGKKYKKCCGGR